MQERRPPAQSGILLVHGEGRVLTTSRFPQVACSYKTDDGFVKSPLLEPLKVNYKPEDPSSHYDHVSGKRYFNEFPSHYESYNRREVLDDFHEGFPAPRDWRFLETSSDKSTRFTQKT
jgi:hypothetical protein